MWERDQLYKGFSNHKYFKNRHIKLIHSNQHYDNNLNRIFFDELDIDTKEVDVLNQKKYIRQFIKTIQENLQIML